MAVTGRSDRSLVADWLRSTFWGWLLGFVFIVVLSVAWDVVGGEAQFMVGVGIGAGVGLVQVWLAGRWLPVRAAWVWASGLGMGAPFVLSDLGGAFGLGVPYSLTIDVLSGGLLVGVLQFFLLRPAVRQAHWWIVASVVGWGVPVGLVALNDSGLVPDVVGTVLGMSGMFLGGAILGLITGRTLTWMHAGSAG